MLLFVDSAGEVGEETAVQNGCHATWAHQGVSQRAHTDTSLQHGCLTLSILCVQPLLVC